MIHTIVTHMISGANHFFGKNQTWQYPQVLQIKMVISHMVFYRERMEHLYIIIKYTVSFI